MASQGRTSASASGCPACGGTRLGDGESEGLCLGCMFELAVESPSLLAELEDGSEAETLASPKDGLAPGSVLGGRYRIRNLLGRGGMGEVWRAFDLKLRVDVALKALLHEWTENERALSTLRQEVRSAREVVSPHVCRVFDLIEIDGQELVSMEYIDGITLWNILKARAPLDLIEAREIALQFLAGIEAIHDADLVHRDIKPENIMVTRSGRVVVMDFGIAKGLAEGGSGTVSGTPAYMAPEQARGDSVTSRADVFSVGVVLAEMVAPGGLKTSEARQQLWQGIRRQPAEIPESPWAQVIERTVREHAGDRYASASALARALEEVTLRVAGAEEVNPYPGLASFTAEDAEYFFGRELEVEEMWKKLQRPHLLGLIGPSGAGKSSFVRAGLLPAMPTGWSGIVTTPGSQPFKSLAQALIPEFAGDAEALREMLHFDDDDVAVSLVQRWHERHDEVLMVFDQFEELFTQNRNEVQERFAVLLGRLALEADVHVLVAMRDDFLFRCQPHEALRPLLSELTLLGPPTGTALRRALIQPALKCGYRFDDETLVDEMVSEISAERGALPLLAFATARLWEHRDREQGALTREAYEHVGSVGGALAQHAETTLESIGHEQLPIVRELFRNLVTAQGTRAAREVPDLLSVFDGEERAIAERVLAALVDARLLTTYEEPADEEGEAPRKGIEVIHESLLSNWPRLVRWQTQDADSAQLRDQLRQVARLWIERGRPEDLLWTGTSFKEYELWRERYDGGLSDSEEQFTGAMKSQAERRVRRRRTTIAAVLLLAVTVAVVTSGLWRRSETARQQARSEALHAEAQKLLALGEVQLEEIPTLALAYATASLELADTPEARVFALRALAKSPPATVLPLPIADGADRATDVLLSHDGAWMVLEGFESLQVVSRDGATHRTLDPFPSGHGTVAAAFDSTGTFLYGAKESNLRVWSVPAFELVDRQSLPDGVTTQLTATPDEVISITEADGEQVVTATAVGQPPRLLGRLRADSASVDSLGRWIAWALGGELFVRPLDDWAAPARRLGSLGDDISWIAIDPEREQIAALVGDEIRVWSLRAGDSDPARELGGPPADRFAFLPGGGRIAGLRATNWGTSLSEQKSRHLAVWDLEAPDATRPSVSSPWLPGEGGIFIEGLAVDPRGEWVITANVNAVGLWPLAENTPTVLAVREAPVHDLEFTPDGAQLVWTERSGAVVQTSLGRRGSSHIVARCDFENCAVDIDREGRFVAVSRPGGAMVVPLGGGPVRYLEGFDEETWVASVAIDPASRLVAAAGLRGSADDKVIRVWDLQSGSSRVFGPTEGAGEGFEGAITQLAFLEGGSLLSNEIDAIRLWSLADGSHRVVATHDVAGTYFARIPGRRAIAHVREGVAITDINSGEVRDLPSIGDAAIAVDPTGSVLAGSDTQGTVRVGSTDGGEPRLLFGHDRIVRDVAVSPDGRWIASGSDDGTIRLWPRLDLSETPLHALPHQELLVKLRSLTNVRVVEDDGGSTGWKVEFAPFSGWEDVPRW